MSLEEIFQYVDFRVRTGSPLFKIEYEKELQDFQDTYRRIAFFVPLAEWFGRSVRQKDVVFVGNGFRSLIAQLNPHYSLGVVALGRTEYTECRKNKISCLPFWRYFSTLIDAYFALPELEKTEVFFQSLKDWFSSFNAKVLVFRSDNTFPERALVLAARAVGIPTVVIQHGLIVLDEKSQNPDLDGLYADKMMVWGDDFRDFYVDIGRKLKSDISVLGSTYLPQEKRKIEDVTVCFLGQPHEKFHRNAEKQKIDSILRLIGVCRKLDVQLHYRPHPRENIEKFARLNIDMTVLSSAEPLTDLLSRTTIVLSWASTALMEASLSQCVAAQVRTKGLCSYDMQQRELCYSIADDCEELQQFLSVALNGQVTPWVVPECLIYKSDDLSSRFGHCLTELGIQF